VGGTHRRDRTKTRLRRNPRPLGRGGCQNGNDQPTEAQIRDSQGRILSRFVRSYDANGRIIEEKQIQENPALFLFGAGGGPQVTAAQLEAMNRAMKTMLSGPNGAGISYTYDDQGRVTEMRERAYWFEKVTTTSYNEQGDKRVEVETMANNLTVPAGATFSMDVNGAIVQSNTAAEPTELPDELFGETKVSYAYQYDSYGNWTQQTVNHKSSFGEASSTLRRMLMYY
jgi:hypothetical protein